MRLVIDIAHRDDPATRIGPSRSFDRRGLRVGRGPANDVVLEDPTRVISGQHCLIDYDSGRFRLIDTSTNGSFVNDPRRPVPRETGHVVADGDRVFVGDYVLTLGLMPVPDEAPAPRPQPPARPLHAAPKPVQRPNPGAAFSGGEPPATAFAFTPPRVARVEIPEDWDVDGRNVDGLMAAPENDPSDPPAPPIRRPPQPPSQPPRPPRDPEPIPVEDPEDVPLEDPVPIRDPEPLPDPDPDEDPEPYRDPPPRQTPPPSEYRLRDDRLYDAFLSGAGLTREQLPPSRAEEVLRTAGEVFRATARGLIETLSARAELKGEFRIERTTIKPRNNNPLKFSATPEEAMLAFLQPTLPAFSSGVKAVEQGFDDIAAHQIAMVRGLEAGLGVVIDTLSPEATERAVGHVGGLGAIVSTARKAALWDGYRRRHAEIRSRAEEDARSLFAEGFARGYATSHAGVPMQRATPAEGGEVRR
ncbi:type VI secretion system-associated FHA domain protein TagH [uncultured Tistrella sp.]|uniref:type VI secretion system-associated FHA domain protein TagH n=1 Tax=Tistrella mobilis TaxID=171437 RepID=UPI000C0A33C1|nr:type VI secretion system-associated FHA domain protein TagH [uncultured Tistrella sp.]MAM77188.1 type VI secretion system-associated FHA domain protein TagH [Tistrella sp.]